MLNENISSQNFRVITLIIGSDGHTASDNISAEKKDIGYCRGVTPLFAGRCTGVEQYENEDTGYCHGVTPLFAGRCTGVEHYENVSHVRCKNSIFLHVIYLSMCA